MNKVIRVKPENLDAVLKAIPGAKEVDAPDYDNPCYDPFADHYDHPESARFLPATEMKGVQLPLSMSGNQAHKIIVDAGIVVD